MKKILFIFALILVVKISLATTYTVVNTNDEGTGSLRAAVTSCLANPLAAPHLINFNIPTTDPGYNSTTGVWTIVFLEDGLPAFTSGNITIDGASQTTFAGNTNPLGPEVCLNGNINTVEFCISIQNTSNIVIKDLIINEFLYGIQVYGENAKFNKFTGNYLGCNHDGTQRKGNYNAIEIISGANNNQVGGRALSERNLVSGNEYAGIRISDAHHNLVINNWVGIDRTGSIELHNYDGITVEGAAAFNQIGGDSACERNVTAGNVAYGVDIFGVGCEGNLIQGNFIGTDATGSYAIPNTYGLLFDDRSHNNFVGGYNPGEGNLISGNTAFGAYFYNNGTNTNSLIGNLIGTNISGTAAIPNETGVHIDGCTYANFVDSNLISGNRANGITLFATYSDYNTIIRNKIGTDITGTLPLGNGIQGILITQGSANNTIGGSPANANIIAYNGRNGVSIESENCDHNLLSCNSIYNNGYFGIELYGDYGFNENDLGDSDAGPNDLLNGPVILNITYSGSQATIFGYIDVANPTTTKIEIYRALHNDIYCSSGKDYLGSTYCNAQGQWSFTFTFASSADYYTALSIDATNNTSEFSKEFPLQIPSGINSFSNNNGMSIYPNPVTIGKQLIIEIEASTYANASLYNILGDKIIDISLNNNKITTIETKEIPSGIYFLKAKNNLTGVSICEKIIITK